MQHSLGRRLVLATLLFCVLFILISTSLRTYLAWNSNLDNMRSELQLIDQVLSATLSKAVWEMDRDTLQTQLDSVTQAEAVGLIELRILREGRKAEIIHYRAPGYEANTHAPELRQLLTYEPYPGAQEHIGELRLVGRESRLWQELIDDVASILLAQVLQSLMIAGLIMWLFNRSVTVHVRHIAQHLSQVSPTTLTKHLRLLRSPRHEDELNMLESGINALQDKLATYLERQNHAEQALAAHRDSLAEQVEERTAELRAANERLNDLNRRDPLTGLANRRHFDETKELELRRARRQSQPLAVMMCDVDHFKLYNDTYGHGAGDRCLCQIADLLSSLFNRSGELVTRLGGEEFAILLPGITAEQALESAQRLQEALRALNISHRASETASQVTMSIGIAQLEDEPDDFEALMQRADDALYRAKRLGRNRIIYF
ncbi:Diguanylate cyclase (GGDEF) domain-containing protein [Pseudomonas sp. 8Z]|uniref:GGDEF domain-containing protein n=1 Tax=Pseudomonas sp. 8Z TaxID=2653166 RepID=UPI0012EF1364|nr:diguanylate cyclase [Pseudomonas sp. 8Z]VXC80295.1 Diguanylate cyclase (GGDEF) domain-containing protein [Pseudomonas sp. 8Z]